MRALAALGQCEGVRLDSVQAIGLSGQMHGATLLDARGDVLRPAILWNDGRSAAQCTTLEERAPALREVAGNPAMSGFTAPKLLWVAEHEPDVFARVDKVLLPKDYVRYRLSGALRPQAWRSRRNHVSLCCEDGSGHLGAATMKTAIRVVSGLLFLSLAPTPVRCQCAVEDAKLLADDGNRGDRFATSVDIFGDVSVIGAPSHSTLGSFEGAAYVFEWEGGAWNQSAKLIGSDTGAHDAFGQSVSVFGNRILVGAYFDDDNGSNSGSAFVFRYDGQNWTQEAKLVPSDGNAFDLFGEAVCLTGDRAAIGARQDSDTLVSAGSVYVFERSGTVWTEQAKLTASDLGSFHHFGRAVSLSGDRLLVGADGHDSQGSDTGAAYVFVRSGSTWTEQARLFASDGEALEFFGWSVSLHEDSALISAPFPQSAVGGAAYSFEYNGSGWVESGKLEASDGMFGNSFGRSVALSSATAMISAGTDDSPQSEAGSAYVFVRQGTIWTEQRKLVASDASAGAEFGRSVACSNGRVLVGAWEDNAATGAAYAFSLLTDPTTFYCTAKLNSCGSLPAIQSIGTPSAGASTGFVVTGTNARNNRVGLLLYTNGGRASLPFQGGLLCVAAPIRRTPPTSSGGTVGNCDGEFQIDMNCFASGNCGGSPQTFLGEPGTRVQCQWWGRDTPTQGSYLSDGLEYTVCQ